MVLASALTAAAGTQPAPPVAGQEALDYGFRFASALDVDPKDKAKAQQSVAMEYAGLGLYDEAVRRAEATEGWRGLAALADIASTLARDGRTDEARALLARVEAQRGATEGWEGPRVDAHLAQVHAALGDVAPSETIARDLAKNDPRQYAGRSAAIQAGAHGARGEYDLALAALRPLDGDKDIEVAWWRTMGYLDLSKKEALDETQRRSALDQARRSAEGLPGWKQAQALLLIAVRYGEVGDRDAAVAAIEVAEQKIEALPPTDEWRPLALSELARAWVAAGEAKRGRRILTGAEQAVPKTLVIDQPALYAGLASGWHAVGDDAEASRLYDRALDAAAGLVNARPRALAVVEICRSLGRERIPLEPATRARLDGLLSGLAAPW
jgi:tetratricopeptide (TPR) repeat protein